MIEDAAYGVADAGPMPWRMMVFESLQYSHCNTQFKVKARSTAFDCCNECVVGSLLRFVNRVRR